MLLSTSGAERPRSMWAGESLGERPSSRKLEVWREVTDLPVAALVEKFVRPLP
jgi:hypothetical protein